MAEGSAVAMNWGSSQGAKGPSFFVISHDGREGRLIKTLGNLQNLSRRIEWLAGVE